MTTPIGHQRQAELVKTIEEFKGVVNELNSALRSVNDQDLRIQATALAEAANAIATNHRRELRPSVADDMAGLMMGVLAFKIPSRDGELGRTPTIDLLRQIKGLLIASLNDTLEAAAAVGIIPIQQPIHRESSDQLPRGLIHKAVPAAIARLASVEYALSELLKASAESPTEFRQQHELVSFYADSMRADISVAKLHLLISKLNIDFDAILRVVELMAT